MAALNDCSYEIPPEALIYENILYFMKTRKRLVKFYPSLRFQEFPHQVSLYLVVNLLVTVREIDSNLSSASVVTKRKNIFPSLHTFFKISKFETSANI